MLDVRNTKDKTLSMALSYILHVIISRPNNSDTYHGKEYETVLKRRTHVYSSWKWFPFTKINMC